jgi:hypothetical protein
LFRYSPLPDPVAMASLEMKIKAEVRMRELLETEGLPPPDAVEYGFGCIRLFFHETKTCIVVDIDDYGEIGESKLGLAPPT